MALQISNCYNYTCINVSPPKYLFLYHAGICTGRKKEKGRSWTVSVLCLSDKNCSFVPNSEVKEYLLKAGLGMKKIRFNVKDGQTEVLKKISSDEKDENDECIGFPALKNCGGFELMRSQANNRSLSTIEVEWSVQNLKACIGSQGKLYVRPIQSNLSTSSVQQEKTTEESNVMLITEICRECGQSIAISELRAHCESCIGEHQAPSEKTDEKNEVSFLEDLPDPLVETFTESIHMTEPIPIPIISSSQNIVFSDSSNAITGSITFPVTEPVPTSAPANSEIVVVLDRSVFPSQSGGNNEFQLSTEAETLKHEDNHTESISNIVVKAIKYCNENYIEDPVEILKYLQSVLVTGRKLDIVDLTEALEGDTNYICVDRSNILETAFEEIKGLQDLRMTLEVQFYGEVCLYTNMKLRNIHEHKF